MKKSPPKSTPLAEILRPSTFDGFFGQIHLAGTGSSFRKMIESGHIHSMIFWGPPGVGKTTLALLISGYSGRPFYTLSAVNAGVKDVREIIEKASVEEVKPILFIDEIHRFSKSQQDSLLAAVERGTVILIGATTENPSFEVIAPLLSRCQVFVLKHLEADDLLKIAQRAILEIENSAGKKVLIDETEALIRISGGDARKLLNAIDIIVSTLAEHQNEIHINNENAVNIIQQNLALYDKLGEMHYDVISAFIKSLRGSDPNGAVYWLARMIAAGEDPLFIARRMLILASEDIGNANPNALLLANSCFDAVNKIGMPEGRIILSQTAVYLATSPKSNASYMAINNALEVVERTGDLPVPLHLRNAPTRLMKDLGYGKNYQYAHDFDTNFTNQEFLPEAITGRTLYNPGKNQREQQIREWLKARWNERYNY